jgi:thiosulfate dehydrogenase [quinone] large subunit
MTKAEIAYLLLRVTLGANLFLHGFSRLIENHAVFAAFMEQQMLNAPLPGFLAHFVAVVLRWCEGIVGLLMILGLWTSFALIAGSLLMLTLQIGSCLAQNWDVAGGQLIYVLSFFVLLTSCERNRWSIDHYWEARNEEKKVKVQSKIRDARVGTQGRLSPLEISDRRPHAGALAHL